MPDRDSAMKPFIRPVRAFIFTKFLRSAPLQATVMAKIAGTITRETSASRQLIRNMAARMPPSRNTSLKRLSRMSP